MASFDRKMIDELERLNRTNLINSISGYKGANLIGTQSRDGQTNLAIFSSVVHLGAHPPLQGMIVRPDSVARHTLENIKETGVYTINQVPIGIRDKAHQCAANYPREVSEFDAVGLEAEYLDEFEAPFVKESRMKVAMKLVDVIDLPYNGTHLVVGEVMHVHVDDEVLENSYLIDHSAAESVAVVGLDAYSLPKGYQRLPYAKP